MIVPRADRRQPPSRRTTTISTIFIAACGAPACITVTGSRGNESAEEAVVNLTHLVAQQASLKPGDRVCDLGCGYGAAALVWRRDYGARVTGITISEKQYRYAEVAAAGNARCRFHSRRCTGNGLPSESFDAVTAVESSEHMPDKRNFSTKPIACCAPAAVASSPPGSAASGREDGNRRISSRTDLREGRLPSLASAAEYRALLAARGISRSEVSGLDRRVKKTWSICARSRHRAILSRPGVTPPPARSSLHQSHFRENGFSHLARLSDRRHALWSFSRAKVGKE